MTYHGTGLDEQTYDSMRMILFGQESLNAWEGQLDDKEGIINDALEQAEEFGYLDWPMDKAKEIASIVFDKEVEEYKSEKGEEE